MDDDAHFLRNLAGHYLRQSTLRAMVDGTSTGKPKDSISERLVRIADRLEKERD